MTDTKKPREFWLCGIHTIEPIIFDADETAKFRKDFNKDGEYIHVVEILPVKRFKIRHPGTLEHLFFETREEAEKYYEGFNPITVHPDYKSLCGELAAALQKFCSGFVWRKEAEEVLAKYRKAIE